MVVMADGGRRRPAVVSASSGTASPVASPEAGAPGAILSNRGDRSSPERAAPAARRAPQRLPGYVKPLIWAGALFPAARLLIGFFVLDDLGANPIEKITNWTGYTTLCLLTVTLSVTPLRRLTGFNPVVKVRRLLGLFAFFYACLHFLTYIVLDQFFALEFIVEDILERPYITVGFTAFVLLVPMAVTSTKGWIRRLGRRWTKLHRLIYIIVPLGVLHFYWKVASKVTGQDVWVFALIVGALLALRLPWIPWQRRRPGSA